MAPPTRTRVSAYDFRVADLAPNDVPKAVLTFTTQKGFCLFNPGFASKVLGEARQEASERETYSQPPVEVAQGLLGDEGSAEIATLHDAAEMGPSLQTIQKYMMDLMTSIISLTEGSLCECDKVSTPLLHSTDIPGEEPPVLTMGECYSWAKVMSRSKFMLVFNFGATKGSLELLPFIHSDCAAAEVTMQPGTLVVLRADALSHSFTSPNKSTLLSYFLTKELVVGSRTDPFEDNGIPAAQRLTGWMTEKLKATKTKEFTVAEPSTVRSDFPSELRLAMNRHFHKPNSVAVRSFACKHPGTWDPTAYAEAMVVGTDLVQEIPFSRFDWTEAYVEDGAAQGIGFHLASKHGAFADGLDLFDQKQFNISIAEARNMDPNQRVVLETGFEALIRANFTNKELVKSLIGCYCGCAMSEYTFIPIDMSSGFGGTSAANSITANRISFVLGIQGPNVAIDCAAASALVGCQQATDTLRFQTDRVAACHHAVVSNVALALALQPYLTQSAAGFLSRDGRCFSFDSTANGYCKGEGVASMVLGRWAEVVDEKPVLNKFADKERPCLGLVTSVNTRHMGRASSLTAPSGPQERELVQYVIDQAYLSPLDVDAWETHGMGWLMSDAVEMSSMQAVFRETEEVGSMLPIGTVKSQSSFMMESCGLAQIMKVIHMQGRGMCYQGIHLNQLNPYVGSTSGDTGAIQVLSEPLRFSGRSSHVGTIGRGFGGIMSALMTWGLHEEDIERRQRVIDPLAYWPAAGTSVLLAKDEDEDEDDDDGEVPFEIVGSWSKFTPQTMAWEDEGVYGFTITLGETGVESFYIQPRGDDTRVLYPDEPHNGARAVGPRRRRTSTPSTMWTLGADDWIIPIEYSAAIGDGEQKSPSSPGRRYRIRLRLSGPFKTVDWVPLGRVIESGST